MKVYRPALVLLVVQLLLVLSVAGKYLYERKVYKRIWVRAIQADQTNPCAAGTLHCISWSMHARCRATAHTLRVVIGLPAARCRQAIGAGL